MGRLRNKTGLFFLEGMNSFATVYYFYYLYFFMHRVHGFHSKANLELAALNGLVCMISSWGGGKFCQRFGYFLSLKVGFTLMIASLAVGLTVHSALGQVLVMVGTTLGMGFTWPSLEALVSHGEEPTRLPRILGIYNVVWAAAGALAYFTGGAMLDRLGTSSLFYVPMLLLCGELALAFWLERQTTIVEPALASSDAAGTLSELEANTRPIAKAKMFLRMAWLANPFAYIAINTVVAVIPDIASHLGLSTTSAGFYCSVWCFARMAAFFALRSWDGWHYKFRWLVLAYLALLGTFATILLVPHLWTLVLAQLLFGLALGLIYYSSLFYSMDSSDTQGEHGGIHEAAIGLGNFAGPAVGAASLHFLPQAPNSSAIAVSGLLVIGFGGLVAIRSWSKWHPA